jgi:type IX secretion system PorP/SprF family membrane protein
MKKGLFVVLFCSLGLCGSAQQIAQYTQYLFNHFGINPAVAGSRECVDIRLGYRTQWVGFEGAPRTAFANINARLKSKRKGRNRGFHAIGAMVESDVTGPTSRTLLNGAYAYHLPLNHKWTMSAGVFAGFQQYRLDVSKITLANYNDGAINGSQSVFVYPDISAGIWIYGEEWYGGLAVRQILKNKVKDIGTDTRLTYHYNLIVGRKITNNDGVSYIPSASFKFAPYATPALDLNILVDFQNKFALGASYRNTDAIAVMGRLNFLKYFTLGYAFDFTTSKIRTASSNTHEVMLGIYACPSSEKDIYSCPAFQ